MRILHGPYVGLCSLAVVAAVLAAQAAAEPVQVSPTVDGNTTALYRFKEGTGTTTACEVAGAPAGTLYGASWVPGREYFAVATGPGYVQMPDAAALRPQNALTVEVWVKLEQSAGDLVCKNNVYLLRLGSTISAYFYIDGSWRSFSGHLSVPTGQWTHLAITYNSATKKGAIYINGVLDTTQQFTGLSTGKINQGTSDLYIGRNDWTQPSGNYATGKVDALRISNVARAFDPLSPPVNPPPTPLGNLVPNGDFELGLTGWRLTGEGDANLVWDIVSNNVASGKKCLHSLPGARTDFSSLRLPGSPAGVLSRPISVYAGRHYMFSARLRASANQTARVSLYAAGGDDLTDVSGFPKSAAVTTGWQQFSWSFIVPSNFTAPSVSVFIPYPSSGELYVDDVRLTGGDALIAPILQDKIAVGPQSLPVGNVYLAGTPTTTTLNVVNTDTVSHNVAVQATVVDWEGKKLPSVALGTFAVPAGGVQTATCPIDTGRRGTFRLGFDLTSEGQTWHQGAEFKYAVVVNMRNVGGADNSMFGMNTHMEREPTPHLDRSMQVLSQCGVKWIRGWWGWGMCENPQGTFDFTEYDRQYNAVAGTFTGGTGMRIMPILLRYYYSYEQTWAGPVTSSSNGIQEYPYTAMIPEWGLFCGKVAQHYAGRVKAYEIWNEPTMGNGPYGDQTPQQYRDLLNAASPLIRQYDPNAKIVGFAGVPTYFMQSVLALGMASQMDVVSEHTYGQVMQPESGYPTQVAAVRSIMNSGGAASKPIWDTEQGVVGDDDGYSVPSNSEADVAALLTRNIVTAASLGESKFFWFSAQCSPTYGYAVFFENYIPRPRLAALNACASFLEGATYQKSYNPSTTTYAHLFKGTTAACVVWNTATALSLSLPIDASKLQAFDTMGNSISVSGSLTKAAVQIPVRRPVYLKCALGDYDLLNSALAGMQAMNVYPVTVTARRATGGIQVTLTGTSSSLVDGIVDLIPAAARTPMGWPAAQHFQSLALGQSTTLTFVVPKTTPVKAVHVSVGDRQAQDLMVPCTGL